ncbi:hypothetical protein CC1G_10005 [Coprinopsis cinerea okayama7|uniref:Ricin B lectin domain-containing protein n=1 Tax=Coprinopsis cinerea (strain Okayama-7 / 130 / ATCC MYA-4618 / FGSC 9003) TaxID=240176 RepID=A8NDJ9_COPC7|nr:hypothetical protein CC1G_10005 [Coprinopsis cinerea okayama7\|eukprot:XP_001832791.2 hypothetical protein CC1G_10005 [Coprinopsis cinerea okayama7\
MTLDIVEGSIYRFVNVHFSATLELDRQGHGTVLNDFTGSAYQQWEARRGLGGLWKFRSVATGNNLGLDLGKIAKNCALTTDTPTEFLWKVNRIEFEGRQCLQFIVPNTAYVLDASSPHDIGGVFPYNTVYVYENWFSGNQMWYLDDNVTPQPPCVVGCTYKISSSNGSSVAHLEDDTGKVSGFRYNEGRNQLWEAVPFENETYLWAFKNVFNGLYLGIDSDSEVAKERTRVVGSPTPFFWYIAPDSIIGDAVRILVPYTTLVLDLSQHDSAPGTVIHLYRRADSHQHWKFEHVGTAERPFGDTLILGPRDPGGASHAETK